MARKRTALPPDVEAEIAARTARGESAKTIHGAIGGPVSVATIERRQQELRGKPPAASLGSPPTGPGRVSAPTPPGPPSTSTDEVPDEPPEDVSLAQLDRWLKACEDGLKQAQEAKNLAAVASLAQKAAALMALRRKLVPLPKADPNENPDMKALAAQTRERLQKLAHGVFDPSGSLAGG